MERERMEKTHLREIEVTVISAEGLLITKKQPVKKNAFIVVRSDPFNSLSTTTDTEGGSHPRWNEKMELQLPAHARFITVEAHSGSKHVGTANIPVTDFCGGFLPENHLTFLSYRLRDANGDKNGIVNLSVKMKAPPPGPSAATCSGPSWTGVQVMDAKIPDHRIVTGIPVSYRF